MTTRKSRGRRSEVIVAEQLQPLFPYARAVNTSTPGPDILETPGIAVECKARRDLDLPGWLRQARRNAGLFLPVLVVRGNGQGEADPGAWAMVVTLGDGIPLLGAAGYGNNPHERNHQ